MLGVIYYLYFLIIGFIYGKYLFKIDKYFHLWIGGVIGNILMMFGIMLSSIIFNFTVLSHLLLIILTIIPILLIIYKSGFYSFKKKIMSFEKVGEMNNKIFIFLILPIFLIIAIILTNHILVPSMYGVSTGQSTYGDLNMHLGFITSIKEQGIFPPNYVFLSGTKLNYPFLINSLSSSLYLFGTSLRLSVLLPSYVICLLLVMGFYFLGYKITNNKKVSILATLLFFLGGGFGFIYFLDGARENVVNFTKIFTDYYHTPTNFNEMNIRWANPICDMIVPQRSTMAGWFMLMPTLWLLIDAVKNNKRSSYILLGILASTMPLIHTHSFLALGVISIGMFVTYFFKQKNKKTFFINWCIYGIIVLIIAFPQLIFWTFRQTVGNSSFLKYHFNWVNHSDPYIWFYIKNFGIVALFIIPAFFYEKGDNRKLIISVIPLFILAELVLFQPNEYDNNKLLFVSYMIFLIMCSDWLVFVFEKLKKVPGRIYLAILVIVLGTLSGILTIIREIKSGGEYTTFSSDMIKMSDYIKSNTPSDSVFLTSTTHINPVSSLAGRTVYVGSSLYVYFHGLGNEYYKRSGEVEKIYQASYEELIDFCKKNNITYIYLGDYEKKLNPNYDTFSKLEKIVSFGSCELYKIEIGEV